LVLLAACDDHARLSSGDYAAVDARMDDTGAAPVGSLALDVEAGTAVFTDAAHAELASTTLSSWARKDWPTGCPTNFTATHMEVADLGLASLQIGAVIIDTPVLVADCPDGTDVILRDDGDFQGGGGAMLGATAWIRYSPRGGASPNHSR